ncbi:hypothetical protein EMIHUDRAFT_228791 [Emiliania huxleyi CCMP1516]|uniref:Uncharacterized protein n=2 Tax=Emiliania huxleyi TaxID=2903 RepID=A0A0D3KEF4_EMIH1|nr:hypothetical protein EMIHUDRAFT_228791 [Emiliania huxleyi CCMP1516]EOD34139.1 hypothetical protein EMIHUDRAFT_228791 [Emiliania huxleyi CCMP1516]|eukprot:XP_005786568.1 hypothetical protein EMIHUDRAFT_228791 [Emiliania huxleyi CCMP1516]
MPTRLQKLVALLANGPSEAARLAAARQLGELQRAHPAQLHVLLQHILRHLFASEWPTRRAAAAALQAVAEAADAWSPEQPEEPDEAAEAAARAEAEGAWLSFRSFEMASALGGQSDELLQEADLTAVGAAPSARRAAWAPAGADAAAVARVLAAS